MKTFADFNQREKQSRAIGTIRRSQRCEHTLRSVDGRAEVVQDIVARLGAPVTRANVLAWHNEGCKTWEALQARAGAFRARKAVDC